MNEYGKLPFDLGYFDIDCKEMMFYQYLPIKINNTIYYRIEDRLLFLEPFINKIEDDFCSEFGIDKYRKSYMYLTIKNMFQNKNLSYNRLGFHSDGFGTEDINYIWSNLNPTVFNNGKFNLSDDDNLSLKQMNKQALKENNVTYPDKNILRLNQFNIHKVNESNFEGYRMFIKISLSEDKYNLEGNSHNFELNYNWDMKRRKLERNIPQQK